MHTLALCTFAASLWFSVPPAKTYKGKAFTADNVADAASEFQNVSNKAVGVTATPTDNWPRWNDDSKFPLDVDLLWSRVEFFGPKPKSERLQLYIIDCGNEKDAKKYFTQLRILRCPDYARSGKYLIKASPQAFEFFTKYYGAERYEVVPKAPAKDK
jgi:hypothetical protein